jgi:hypothetical protein
MQRRKTIGLVLLILFAWLVGGFAYAEPQVNPPYRLREPNYAGGSCSYASTITLLRWQGQYNIASYVRMRCAGGTNPEVLAESLDECGVRYAMTVGQRDVAFLEWACRTRRGAAIGVYGDGSGSAYEARHMLNLVHLDSKWAGILDNNYTQEILWIPRDQFLRHWIGSGSWAVVPCYSPAPPLPPVPRQAQRSWPRL